MKRDKHRITLVPYHGGARLARYYGGAALAPFGSRWVRGPYLQSRYNQRSKNGAPFIRNFRGSAGSRAACGVRPQWFRQGRAGPAPYLLPEFGCVRRSSRDRRWRAPGRRPAGGRGLSGFSSPPSTPSRLAGDGSVTFQSLRRLESEGNLRIGGYVR